MQYASRADLPDEAKAPDGSPSLIVAAATDRVSPTFNDDDQIIRDLPILRTGKFKDSAGNPREFTKADLHDMVATFYKLRDAEILPNVPVRENHSRDVRAVGGYFKELRVSDKPNRKGHHTLLADLEMTEPEVYARYKRGTYRSRSIEVGAYETNDGEIHFPTVVGVAFCDLPAVEGLIAASLAAYSDDDKPEVTHFSTDADADGGAGDQTTAGVLDGVLDGLRQAAETEKDPDRASAVQRILNAVELLVSGTAAPTTASGDNMDTFKFTLGDKEIEVVGDDSTRSVLATFAAQNAALAEENKTLAEQVKQSVHASREARVDTWLADKKITPAQVPGLKELVKTLSDDQFAAQDAIIAGGAVLNFAAEVANTGGDDGRTPETEKIEAAKQQYKMLQAAGVTGEKLAASKAAKTLAAHNITPGEE